MIKLGIVDFDTSHVVQFSKRLNHKGIEEEQWVEGAQIVCGCPGTSAISPERIAGHTDELRKIGVEILDKPEDIIGKVDGVLIESVDGSVHLERARPFIEAGLPLFIDKPFTSSLADAKELVELAEKKGVPLFSSSSLRYALEVVEAKQDPKVGPIVGADAFSPAPTHPRNPGLFHYGIHGVETLYSLMGQGCASVWCVSTDGVDVVTGIWKDERVGVMRGIREGARGYGFTAYGEKGVRQDTINTAFIYRELLKQIVEFFKTGKSPVPIEETLEIMAFMEAAMESGARNGKRVDLKV